MELTLVAPTSILAGDGGLARRSGAAAQRRL